MPSTTVGTGSFLAGASTLLYSWSARASGTRKVAVVPEDTVFTPWPSEDHGMETDTLEPECTWWNGSVTYTTTTCSHFHVSRIAPTHSKQALYRALRCAVAKDTECVLAAEIGFALPAAFLYGGAGELRMAVAPRLSDTPDNSTTTVRVSPIERHHADPAAQKRDTGRVHRRELAGASFRSVHRPGSLLHSALAPCLRRGLLGGSGPEPWLVR